MMESNDLTIDSAEEGSPKVSVSFLLLVVGFILILIGIGLVLLQIVFFSSGSTSAGIIIFIGPFPIIVGVGSDITFMLLFSIFMVFIISLFSFIILVKRK